MLGRVGIVVMGMLVGLISTAAAANPKLTVIIDDIGHLKRAGYRAVNLPGPVVLAFLPQRAYTQELAQAASKKGLDIMLHQPMESVDHRHMGDGSLNLDMSQQEVESVINSNLRSLPGVVGVNNHMGSLLTQHPGYMAWVMEVLSWQDVIFVDSVTSPKSVAYTTAQNFHLKALRRDVFLDSVDDESYVERQLRTAIDQAKRHGSAIAIGHPYDSTLTVLERMLPQLSQYGVELVGIKASYQEQQHRLLTKK